MDRTEGVSHVGGLHTPLMMVWELLSAFRDVVDVLSNRSASPFTRWFGKHSDWTLDQRRDTTPDIIPRSQSGLFLLTFAYQSKSAAETRGLYLGDGGDCHVARLSFRSTL